MRPLPGPLRDAVPVFVAPMAGGASAPELVIAAAGAKHFAQLAAGYRLSLLCECKSSGCAPPA